ncbi:Protein Y47G6A.19 a [Aphelenchoides avenae]|nr:Protein Y47G6A.19 a [Aphelenchus avenae]
MVPENAEQLLLLADIHITSEYDFWKAPTGVNKTVDVMVNEDQEKEFTQFLKAHGIGHHVLVSDLSKFIDEKETADEARVRAILALRADRMKDDVASNDFGLSMANYHSYDDMVAFMKRVHAALPANTKMISIGRTVEGREIQGIQFGDPRDASRPVIWIDAGIHAREWTAVHTAVYFIYLVANGMHRDSKLKEHLGKVDLLIIPCANPDGYEFTRTEPRNPSVRMWRKNRSLERCANNTRGERRCCKGVDLNRNFDFRFAGMFSHRKHTYPKDVAELKLVAQKAVDAIGQKFGTHYMYGNGPDIIYAYAGGSTDWAKQTANIKYTYTIELRPTYFSWNGFILERSQLIPTARETFDGILVVLETIAQKLPAKGVNVTKAPMPIAPATLFASTTCADTSSHCEHWINATPTICAERRNTMWRDCKRSCRFCA